MFWKIYFWVMMVFILLAVLIAGADAHWRLHIVDWLNLLFMIVGLIGVFGYAYKRRIATKNFWIFVTLISLVYQLVYSFALDQAYGALPATGTADELTTFAPLVPMFIALYLYISRSKLLN